jgi:hypothetical protein
VIVSFRKLWSRKLCNGPEVIANLFYDQQVGDATLELTVRASQAEDVVAIELSETLRVDKQGATPLTESST